MTPLIAPRRLGLVLATAAFCLTAYDGCDSANPVISCSVPNDGHAIPSFGAQTIATFFSQF